MLALLAFTRMPLPVLESIGMALFAALIGYLASLTGGVLSPLVVWFALVPAEAALAGGRPAVLRAAVAAAVALAVVAAIQAMGALPISRLPVPVWEIYACPCWPRWFRPCSSRPRRRNASAPPILRPPKAPRCIASWPTMRWT